MTAVAIRDVREFTSDDWMGYQGAEAWKDSEPLIYEHSIGGHHTTVIADKTGFDVIVTVEDHVGSTTTNYVKKTKLSPALARAWMPALAGIDHKDLIRSGFIALAQ